MGVDSGVEEIGVWLGCTVTSDVAVGKSVGCGVAVFVCVDARSSGVKRWWFVVPAAPLVGLSMAMPTYLLLRECQRHHSPDSTIDTSLSTVR